jgi:hypothetical protein
MTIRWKSSAFSKSNDGIFVENQNTDKGFGKISSSV